MTKSTKLFCCFLLLFTQNACVHLSPSKAIRSYRLSISDPIVVLYQKQQCNELDAAYTKWSAASIVLGVLAGGNGVTTAVLPDNTPRYVTGSVSLLLGAGAALSAFMSASKAQKYTADCTRNSGGN